MDMKSKHTNSLNLIKLKLGFRFFRIGKTKNKDVERNCRRWSKSPLRSYTFIIIENPCIFILNIPEHTHRTWLACSGNLNSWFPKRLSKYANWLLDDTYLVSRIFYYITLSLTKFNPFQCAKFTSEIQDFMKYSFLK